MTLGAERGPQTPHSAGGEAAAEVLLRDWLRMTSKPTYIRGSVSVCMYTHAHSNGHRSTISGVSSIHTHAAIALATLNVGESAIGLRQVPGR